MTQRFGGILCAGFGSRMRPLTEVMPKPLLPFLNTPLLAYGMDHLKRAGVQTVGLNLHHLAASIPPVAQALAAQLSLEVQYAIEPQVLGTAGGIRGIADACEVPDNAPLAIMNGDSIMNLDVGAVFDAHAQYEHTVTLVVRPRAEHQPGRVWLDGQGQIVRIRDHKSPLFSDDQVYEEYDFCGVHIIDGHLTRKLSLTFGDIITELYGPMLEQGQVLASFVYDDFWVALDTPKHLLETQRLCLQQPDLFAQAPLPESLSPNMFVMRPGAIGENVQVAAPMLTGINVDVEQNVRIGPNVVMDGVFVLPGSLIKNALLYGMGTLEGHWEDCVAVAGKVASVDFST